MKWYSPQLITLDIKSLIKNISVKAMSVVEPDDCYGGNILKGDIGGGGQVVPGIGGDWMLYCLEYGPLGGCEEGTFVCSESSTPVLSNPPEQLIG